MKDLCAFLRMFDCIPISLCSSLQEFLRHFRLIFQRILTGDNNRGIVIQTLVQLTQLHIVDRKIIQPAFYIVPSLKKPHNVNLILQRLKAGAV